VWKDGYVQQCALPEVSLDANPNLEVALVARANITVDPQSVPASVPGRIVSGRIVENTPSGTRPLSGAFIDFEPVMDYPAATTYSVTTGAIWCAASQKGPSALDSRRASSTSPCL